MKTFTKYNSPPSSFLVRLILSYSATSVHKNAECHVWLLFLNFRLLFKMMEDMVLNGFWRTGFANIANMFYFENFANISDGGSLWTVITHLWWSRARCTQRVAIQWGTLWTWLWWWLWRWLWRWWRWWWWWRKSTSSGSLCRWGWRDWRARPPARPKNKRLSYCHRM